MRKVILLILFTVSVHSQIVVGEYSIFSESPNKNKKDKIELLKSKKTLFILPETFSIENYTKAIAEVWDITPFEVIWTTDYKEMKSEEKDKTYGSGQYSTFQMNTSRRNIITKGGSNVDYVFHTLDLTVYKVVGKTKNGNDRFDFSRTSTIFFTPSIDQRQKDLPISAINPSLFLNYDLGYLKAYLKIVNKNLKANAFVNSYDDFYDKEAIKSLKTHKLIIPRWVAEKYNAFSRTEGEQREDEDLMKDYKFPYEIVSDGKLDRMLLDNEGIYFLSYAQVNGKKMISIIDYKNGDIIYNSKTGMSYNVKSKDFKAISNKIED